MLRRARGPIAALVLAVLIGSACGAGGFLGKRYEYEEDVTISLDGSATLTINTSIPALVALRGLDLDPANSRVDRDKIRASYKSGSRRLTSAGSAKPLRSPGQTTSSLQMVALTLSSRWWDLRR
jgi:hypothetical protein